VIKRREFIVALGGAAAWPVAASAQQSRIPLIGVLSSGTRPSAITLLNPFQEGLREMGFIEGRNLAIEFRGTDRYEELPGLAAELVQRQVSVIFSMTNINAALAAKAATTTIPVVFTTGADPVKLGLVASMNRPGGNITGVSVYGGALVPKRLGLLRELVPGARTIAFLVNSTNYVSESDTANVLAAARSVGQEMLVVSARNPDEIDAAFATAHQRAQGLLVNPDALFFNRRVQLAVLAARYGIPTCYYLREYAASGGLMSYGDERSDSFRQAGIYVGRILKGEKPTDLPVMQPSKFEFVINLSTAKALGLAVPPTLLALATEVIE
jgi:putative ABC transport system substrate-binding protein